MAVISTNTSFTLPSGSTLTFTEGGIGRAIVDGNGYTLGLADVILGPFTQAKTVQVLVTNAPISYYTLAAPASNADRVPVVVDPLTGNTTPSTSVGTVFVPIEGAPIAVYGNSFGVAPGLACTAGLEYFKRFGASTLSLASSVATYCVSGSGLYEVCYDLNGARVASPGASVSGSGFGVSRSGIVFLNALTNMYTNPSATGAVQPVSSDSLEWLRFLCRSIFATLSAGTRIEQGSAVETGTWTTFSDPMYSGGAVRYATAQGATSRYTVTTTAPSTDVWVMAYVTDDNSAFSVSVNGVVQATFSQPATKPTMRSFRFGNFANVIVGPQGSGAAYAFPVFTKVAVPAGTNNVTLTKTDSGSGSVIVDGAIVCRDISLLPEVVTFLDPLPTVAGARAEVVGRVQFAANKALIDPVYSAVCAEFPNVNLVDLSDLLDVGGVSVADNLHPNDYGMLVIKQRSMSALAGAPYPENLQAAK